jgi:glutamate N-acetyltransferase / amino-acid N-acetyltransferase
VTALETRALPESLVPGLASAEVPAPLASRAKLAQLPTALPQVERRSIMPGGFLAGGLAAGIKRSGKPDLAVIVTGGAMPQPTSAQGAVPLGPRAAVAALFTRNQLPAAPVRLSEEHLLATEPRGGGRFGWTHGLIATSGSANAATGAAGDADQRLLAQKLAACIGTSPQLTLALSTGIIGTRLPVETVRSGLHGLLPTLGPGESDLLAAATALRTTDSTTKVATATATIQREDGEAAVVRVTGIAKGVGMIHPGMATMLAVLLTDATIDPETLAGLLREAGSRTWNQLSVDGDTSTNDTVLLLASGAAGAAPVAAGTAAATALGDAITAVARDLARQQAADGEGATTLITCQVTGAADDVGARAVARAVVSSSLVKAAVHGHDPNWGRVLAAAGNAHLPDAEQLEMVGIPTNEAAAWGGRPVAIDADRLGLAIAGHAVFDGAAGGPLEFDRDAARAAMAQPEVVIRIDLGEGTGSGEAFGCDLTEAYVRENAEYTT